MSPCSPCRAGTCWKKKANRTPAATVNVRGRRGRTAILSVEGESPQKKKRAQPPAKESASKRRKTRFGLITGPRSGNAIARAREEFEKSGWWGESGPIVEIRLAILDFLGPEDLVTLEKKVKEGRP